VNAAPARADIDRVLEVRDLCVAYGKVEALHNVNLCVPKGRIVTVIGPNGAGKTTLLAAIMGALPVVGANAGSVRGEVRFAGADCAGAQIEQMVARGMTLVPEKRELFGEMTVEDNLLLGAFQRYRSGLRDQVQTMAEVFALFPRLQERRAQLAGTLSGGERQMLAIGRALMAKPRLLMLDEPSLGLAPLIVREIFHIIDELRRRGASILLFEQNAHAALQLADDAYVLETGEVALAGPAAELARDPRVVDTYLGIGRRQDA
jgi:branched-chain amino acid transport system ATP-binding protein